MPIACDIFTGDCLLEKHKLTSPSITAEVSVQYNLKIASVIHICYLHKVSRSNTAIAIHRRLYKFYRRLCEKDLLQINDFSRT